jgi:beta-phosphoglucomutase family hydrolase
MSGFEGKKDKLMTTLGFDAVIFDLDGVITQTALVHSAAWKSMFDNYLREREKKHGEPFREFTVKGDYLPYVDGKPRYDGVKSFLESRGISLPWGDPSDPPEKETICGIGNRKNIAFNETLKKEGVKTYKSTVKLIRELKEKGIRIGVASSSKNCEQVLKAAGLLELMETRVDGVVSAELGLKGKPEPDIFTTAADNLGVTYGRSIVVEDAVSGVAAGKKGNFGLVIGIAREHNGRELLINGADIVVNDMEEITTEDLTKWFRNGLYKDGWRITYNDYDPGKEKTREALLAIGNGYFGTRGAMEETSAGPNHYPGTYMTGVYNRLVSKVAGKDVENEDFVNVTNWLPVKFRIDDGDWLDADNCEVLEIKRVLHFDSGVLYRRMLLQDAEGRQTKIESKRVASMEDAHLAALQYSVTPLNYDGKITVSTALEGNHINAGVERYRQLNQQHLEPVASGCSGNESHVVVRTVQSRIEIATASKIKAIFGGKEIKPECEYMSKEGIAETVLSQKLIQNETFTLEKIVGIFTSKDPHVPDPLEAAKGVIANATSFEEVASSSEKRWEHIWDRIDVKVVGDRLAQKLLRMHLYHLMVSNSTHHAWLDAGIPARGLHGEAYRGHIFWDELFILPFYNIQFPEVSRSVLMYRYRRLEAARKYAQDHGYKGAMFPWQSGSDGREETQTLHLNPVSGEWGDDHSSLQRHVSLAIAYNLWQYYHVTDDKEFMRDYGCEVFFEICRFWASKCVRDEKTGKYSIPKVMGPDEFHEKYPDSDEGGLKDNAYTNIMVAWMFEKAGMLYDEFKVQTDKFKVLVKVEELNSWEEIEHNLRLVVNEEGIIAQYDGYFELKELDWDEYRKKYGNVYRMDRILKAEGKSPDEYKVAKQADTLMTFYNLEKAEVDEILDKMGVKLPDDYIEKNLKYYLARTSHGSTLSRVVHAHLANLVGDRELGWELYMDALTSDYQDIQGGTTAEGIHSGVMAGTIWIALTTFGGLSLHGDWPVFRPNLPGPWEKISFGFDFKGVEYEAEVARRTLRIKAEGSEARVPIELNGDYISLVTGEWSEFSY